MAVLDGQADADGDDRRQDANDPVLHGQHPAQYPDKGEHQGPHEDLDLDAPPAIPKGAQVTPVDVQHEDGRDRDGRSAGIADKPPGEQPQRRAQEELQDPLQVLSLLICLHMQPPFL
ncbi:hypothetical protein SDC9_118857 [bioreactor metagenome]|uniref:Uncharacterized protein n=1 Tax=bioreactor metagenome TaxID=1076179 RepID=A0A645C227_9ZZZZ